MAFDRFQHQYKLPPQIDHNFHLHFHKDHQLKYQEVVQMPNIQLIYHILIFLICHQIQIEHQVYWQVSSGSYRKRMPLQ